MGDRATCGVCGEPMPPGEEMFNYHGYSGPCPKPPLSKKMADAKHGGWQPIETAPKAGLHKYDAKPFLAWCPDKDAPSGGDIRIVWWEPAFKNGAGTWTNDADFEVSPTHWMPLPTTPEPPR